MTPGEFVAYLRTLDIQVESDGDVLRCNAPEGALTSELRAALTARKGELLSWLRANPQRTDASGATASMPLSFAQQRLWFLNQLEPHSSAYIIAGRCRFSGPSDRAALEQALSALAHRHEALRTLFQSINGEPVQRICEPQPITLEVIDLSAEPAGSRAIRAWWAMREEALRPFDLAQGPLWRAVLIERDAQEHDLLLAVHHIVADGWSLGVLARELKALYEAFRAQLPAPLASLPIQYADFALWQRQWLRGNVLSAQTLYWKARLASLPPPLQLPTDYARSVRESAAGASYDFLLPRTLADALRALSRRENVTLFMLLLAAFKVLIARYSGRDDIIIGTPVANRNHVEFESVVGLFVNTLVLRTDLSGEPTFRELLARVRETCLGAYAHPDMPFEKLVEELQPERTPGVNPLFQVSFVLQDHAPEPDFAFVTVGSPFDLTWFMNVAPDGSLGATVQYRSDLFEPATIARMAGHFNTLLEGVLEHPARRLWQLPLSSTEELRQLLLEWNATTSPYPRERAVHRLFEDEVDLAPAAIALLCGEEQLTYQELDARANQLAHYLCSRGLAPGDCVGVLLERSTDLIVSLLAILKAGCTYLPLDLHAPAERLVFVLRDAAAGMVLTHAALTSRLPAQGPQVCALDVEKQQLSVQSTARPEIAVDAEELAYTMYTSGSTGEPKGVAVPHRSITRLVKGTNYAHFGRDETFLHLTAASFDAATFEIWGALLNGARLVIAPPGLLAPQDLAALLSQQRVTTLWLTAALFEQMVEQQPKGLRGLRQLLAGGDVLSAWHVQRLLQACPALRLINGYGPTEGTTFSCCYTITQAPPAGRSVPIGAPVANTRVYVLDAHQLPAPLGVPGELWIGGDGVARGYLNRPELTAARFVTHTLAPGLTERLYRSGDLVRWRMDGVLEFIGRLDEQVKIRGHRVEPAEIEAALRRDQRVRAALVVARPDSDGERRLVAYVAAGEELDMQQLRESLRRTLPLYMLPAALVRLAALPLNANGKVDRRALPEPGLDGVAAGTLGPRDELEWQLMQIWRELLPAAQFGVRDSFFDVGGHSLLAVKLFAKIETTLAAVLPLATLFETPDIEGLARLIRAHTRAARQGVLVRIQTGGGRPPLFAVPGVGGNVVGFHALARRLGSEQPFYGLQSRGLDGTEAPATRIDKIAAVAVKEIRTVQPHGPYRLIGMCMGGIVAYEMAQQLQAQAQQVELLALVDARPPPVSGARTTPWPHLVSLRFFAKRIRLYLKTLSQLHGRERLRYMSGRLKTFKDILLRRDLYRGAKTERLLFAVEQANLFAYECYRAAPYSGPLVLVCAEARRAGAATELRRAWAGLALGPVHFYSVPADDSGQILAEPHVQAFAEQLRASIRQIECAQAARMNGAQP